MKRVLPSGKPIFLRRLTSYSPLFDQFNTQFITEIFCNSENACGYVIQPGKARFSENGKVVSAISNTNPFHIIDTLGNPIVHFNISKHMLTSRIVVETLNGQHMGTVIKGMDWLNHTYTIYNAYENRIGYLKASRFRSQKFNLYSVRNQIIGQLSKAKHTKWAILINDSPSYEMVFHEQDWHQQEKMVIIAASVGIELNHF